MRCQCWCLTVNCLVSVWPAGSCQEGGRGDQPPHSAGPEGSRAHSPAALSLHPGDAPDGPLRPRQHREEEENEGEAGRDRRHQTHLPAGGQ